MNTSHLLKDKNLKKSSSILIHSDNAIASPTLNDTDLEDYSCNIKLHFDEECNRSGDAQIESLRFAIQELRIKSDGIANYFVKNDQKAIVGEVKVKMNSNFSFELIVFIYKDQRSKGYGTECIEELVKILMTNKHIEGITIFAQPEQIAFHKVLLKSKFIPIVGQFKQQNLKKMKFRFNG